MSHVIIDTMGPEAKADPQNLLSRRSQSSTITYRSKLSSTASLAQKTYLEELATKEND